MTTYVHYANRLMLFEEPASNVDGMSHPASTSRGAPRARG